MIAAKDNQKTREAILDAADSLMSRIGFRKMSMEDLAREARVSRRTIYLHFANKEDVGLSSIGRVVESAALYLELLVSDTRSAAERVREMLQQRVLIRVHAISNYFHGLDELFEAVRPAYLARREHYFQREAKALADVLRQGMARGEFLSGDPANLARNLLLATNAFLPYSLSVRELGEPEAIQTRLESMIELLVRGLQVRNSENL